MRSGQVVVTVVAGLTLLGSCASVREPAPAITRQEAPPWPAPADALSYIKAAGLPQVRLDARENPHIVQVDVVVDDARVEIPAFVGVDRLRAVQAPVHTHDNSGQVWIEGALDSAPTLAQFFTLWGVRWTPTCLGAACGQLRVQVDGRDVPADAEVTLREASKIRIEARSTKG